MRAEPDHWKNEPFGETVSIPFQRSFDNAEFNKLSEGLIPESMEDKWFIYLDGDQLCFFRSWTGQPVYRVTLEKMEGGYLVAEAEIDGVVNEAEDAKYEARLLGFLISNLLLGQDEPFPRASGLEEPTPGVLQHHVAGTGYAELTTPTRPWWLFWK